MTNIKFKNEAFVPGFINLMDKFLTEDFQANCKITQPAANIVETENTYDILLFAPGLSKSDFKITVERNLLTISYETKEDIAEKTEKYIRQEYTINNFKRSFTLNDKLNADEILAKYENGILSLSIQKVVQKEPEVKSVEIV